MHRIIFFFLGLFLTASLANIALAKKPWEKLPMPQKPGKANSSGYIKANGIRLYYAIYGEGEPLILLHGGLGHGEHWGGQINQLSKAYKIITIDNRGHGRSSWDKKAISYKQMSRDVIAVMDGLRIQKASILGWSDGGIIGLHLALDYPKRMKKVLVFGTNYNLSGLKSRPKGNTTFPQYMKKAATDYKAISPAPKLYASFVRQMSKMWKSQPRLTPKHLKSISVPVVILVGQYDEIIKPAHSDVMAKLIPGARKVPLKNMSHFALWQSPEVFNQKVLEALRPVKKVVSPAPVKKSAKQDSITTSSIDTPNKTPAKHPSAQVSHNKIKEKDSEDVNKPASWLDIFKFWQ